MWYDATEKFPAQLHEVERKDYLAAKTREFRNQRALQSVSDEGGR